MRERRIRIEKASRSKKNMEGGDVSIGEDELEFKETLVTALKKREKTMLMKRKGRTRPLL